MGMKRVLIITAMLVTNIVYSQDVNDNTIEDELELQSENIEEEIEDNSWMEQLTFFRKHPLNINVASEIELTQLLILSPIQINNLIRYRSLLGALVHVNELQAVPGWTTDLIRRILPFITINDYSISSEKIWNKIKAGRKSLLVRSTQELSDSESSNYVGNPQHVLLKFQYNNGRQFQSGLLLEKDAGEPWLVNKGFDFTSFHFFVRDLGIIKQLALGDFQMSMGQGLVQWQGMATKKSANTLMIKHQNEVLNPYRSSGEINFNRGVAITLGRHYWSLTVYGSIRKLSASTREDGLNGTFISSISNSGYHRTNTEINNRNNVKQNSMGGRFSYAIPNGQVALNFVNFSYSLPILKKQEPYQLFAANGKSFMNCSIDYAYTFKNMHLFGEIAIDKKMNKAWLSGLLLSLDKQLDLSLLFRSISPAYSSNNANAFMENSSVANETGLFTGISARLFSQWKIDCYADVFYSPWLKYRTDAPSCGSDFLIQCSWMPNRKFTLYTRWKFENKEFNNTTVVDRTNGLTQGKRKGFRAHLSWNFSRSLSLRERWETCFYNAAAIAQKGSLTYTDLQFHPPFKPYDLSGRLLLFETDGYESRIYTFEKNVLNSFSIPFFYGKGAHAAVSLHFDIKSICRNKYFKKHEVGLWISLSGTHYHSEPASNSIQDSRHTTTFHIQVLVQ